MKKVLVGILALTLVSCGSENEGQESQVDLSHVNSTHSSAGSSVEQKEVSIVNYFIHPLKRNSPDEFLSVIPVDEGCYSIKKYHSSGLLVKDSNSTYCTKKGNPVINFNLSDLAKEGIQNPVVLVNPIKNTQVEDPIVLCEHENYIRMTINGWMEYAHLLYGVHSKSPTVKCPIIFQKDRLLPSKETGAHLDDIFIKRDALDINEKKYVDLIRQVYFPER